MHFLHCTNKLQNFIKFINFLVLTSRRCCGVLCISWEIIIQFTHLTVKYSQVKVYVNSKITTTSGDQEELTDLLNNTISGFQTFSGKMRITLIPPKSVGSQLSW